MSVQDSEMTCPIVVAVKPAYSPEHSSPDDDRFVFVYYISIQNLGEQTVQLISRHWLITDANGKVEEIRGDGVVGEQPVLASGEKHDYNSFRRCPYAMRACMALHYAGIQREIREVDLKHKPQALLDIAAKATVAVLHLQDGRVIDESLDIMLWALSRSDPEQFVWHFGKSCSHLAGDEVSLLLP